MKKREVNGFTVAWVVALLLSLITFIAVTITGDWTVRNVYNILFFTFFNFTILLMNWLFFTKKKTILNAKARDILRKSFIIIYSFLYLWATFSFLSTGQITRVQTVMFLTMMYPVSTVVIVCLVIAAALIEIIMLLTNKMPIKQIKPKQRKKEKRIFLIMLVLFIITILVNLFYLQIEEPLILNDKALIPYQMQNLETNKLLDVEYNSEKKPNVIWIMLESVSADRVHYYGYEKNVTPNIDNLLSKSIVFKEAYSVATHSDYAQPGILSSRYMLINEYRNLFDKDYPRKFIWDLFKEDGYHTGYFSSQDDRWEGMNKYFDFSSLDNYSYSITDGVTDYGSGFAMKDLDHKTTDLSVEWIKNAAEKDEPFFFYTDLQATHQPYVYPENYSKYKPDDIVDLKLFTLGGEAVNNRYDNAIMYVDEQVGRLLSTIKELGVENNTVIVITSDHGHDLYNRHDVNEHGKSIYSEELLVPLAFYFPGIEHQMIKERVSHIDVVPTLIDILGYKMPIEFQGQIMVKDRPVYFMTQSHKYLIGGLYNGTKIILDINRELVEVYDIENDPAELNDLYEKRAYTSDMLRVLFWHYCQKDYYEKERWKNDLNNRCAINNNFKI